MRAHPIRTMPPAEDGGGEPDPSDRASIVRPLQLVRGGRAPFLGDDAALVAGMLAGDRAAIAAFYDRHEAHVRRTLLRALGPDRDLDDLHHDVLVRALGSIEELRDPAALRPWLTSIAVFTARTHILRRSRRWWMRLWPGHELPEVEAPTASGEVTEALRATYAVLETLPADERLAFALRFIGGMELTEVAEACRCSLATIKRRLSRAQALFQERARAQPALAEWLEGGTRWATPKST